jgi:hypothetical protein
MKLAARALAAFLVIASALVFAAEEDSYPEPGWDWLRSDYRSSHVVAHVRVNRLDLLSHVGDYYLYAVDAVIAEPFKGAWRKDWKIVFHTVSEGEMGRRFDGERIVFLRWSDDTPTKEWKLGTIENSTFPWAPKLAQRLRALRAASGR